MCNPRVPYPRSNHVCVLVVQMAMHHVRSKAPLLIPFAYTEADIAGRVSKTWAPECSQKLLNILLRRDFEQFCTDALLMNSISGICLFCEKVAVHPGEMLMHLVQHHQAQRPGYAHFVRQLAACMSEAMVTDHQCSVCDSIFNLPTHEETDQSRQFLVQQHLQYQCPNRSADSAAYLQGAVDQEMKEVFGRCAKRWLASS